MVVPETLRVVPPQPRAYGLDAGKSTWSRPSPTPSEAPLSPAAQQTVTPSVPASWNAWLICCCAWAVHEDSGPPQLIEMTDGALVVSCTAVVMASRKPWSVLGAK